MQKVELYCECCAQEQHSKVEFVLKYNLMVLICYWYKNLIQCLFVIFSQNHYIYNTSSKSEG